MFSNEKHEKAEELLKSGKVQEAISMYTDALNDSPNDPVILSDRGVAFLHLSDEPNCMSDLNKAIELEPNYAYRYAARAFAKAHFKNVDSAIEDYKKAIELDPDDAVAHNNLGMLLEQKGYADEAKARFERADSLSKQEDHLLDLMDEMEEPNQNTIESTQAESSDKDHVESSTANEMKKIFTSKKQFKEFLNYIKNGFRIK
jgi:Flp pilus assembly protein TadD